MSFNKSSKESVVIFNLSRLPGKIINLLDYAMENQDVTNDYENIVSLKKVKSK